MLQKLWVLILDELLWQPLEKGDLHSEKVPVVFAQFYHVSVLLVVQVGGSLGGGLVLKIDVLDLPYCLIDAGQLVFNKNYRLQVDRD